MAETHRSAANALAQSSVFARSGGKEIPIPWNVWCYSSAEENAIGRVQIHDSGYVGRIQAAQDIYWIDNERVLFLGSAAQEQEKFANGQGPERLVLYIWTVRSDAIVPVDANRSTIQSVCFQSAYTWKNPPKSNEIVSCGYAPDKLNCASALS